MKDKKPDKYTVQEIEGMGEEELNTLAAELMGWVYSEPHLAWTVGPIVAVSDEYWPKYIRRSSWRPCTDWHQARLCMLELGWGDVEEPKNDAGSMGRAWMLANGVKNPQKTNGIPRYLDIDISLALLHNPLKTIVIAALLTHLSAEGRLEDE